VGVEQKIEVVHIQPGKPTQNGRVDKIAAWRMEYNEERPHSSLGYLTPNEFAARERTSYGKDACQKAASVENAEDRVSHFPTAPATAPGRVQGSISIVSPFRSFFGHSTLQLFTGAKRGNEESRESSTRLQHLTISEG
jgi:Integrase core domain